MNAIPQGNERILIVDDDDTVRETLSLLLQELGYSVAQAIHGKHALDILSNTTNTYSLVLLDLRMPVMDGGTLFPLLRKQFPSLPVILCSGFEHDHVVQRLMENGAYSFIRKPVSFPVLAREVRSAKDTCVSPSVRTR
ncbi:response regulator [bacterium]|nr:response regulator [bacterium]